MKKTSFSVIISHLVIFYSCYFLALTEMFFFFGLSSNMTAWNELPTREPLFFALLQCPNVTMLMRSIFIEAQAHNVTKESKAREGKKFLESKKWSVLLIQVWLTCLAKQMPLWLLMTLESFLCLLMTFWRRLFTSLRLHFLPLVQIREISMQNKNQTCWEKSPLLHQNGCSSVLYKKRLFWKTKILPLYRIKKIRRYISLFHFKGIQFSQCSQGWL